MKLPEGVVDLVGGQPAHRQPRDQEDVAVPVEAEAGPQQRAVLAEEDAVERGGGRGVPGTSQEERRQGARPRAQLDRDGDGVADPPLEDGDPLVGRDPAPGQVRMGGERLLDDRGRCLPAAYPLRASSSLMSWGTTLSTSPTMPRSASLKIGASASLLIATMFLLPFMPTVCCMAPLIPQAM